MQRLIIGEKIIKISTEIELGLEGKKKKESVRVHFYFPTSLLLQVFLITGWFELSTNKCYVFSTLSVKATGKLYQADLCSSRQTYPS